jgi:hypothetical protein
LPEAATPAAVEEDPKDNYPTLPSPGKLHGKALDIEDTDLLDSTKDQKEDPPFSRVTLPFAQGIQTLSIPRRPDTRAQDKMNLPRKSNSIMILAHLPSLQPLTG